MLEWQQDGLDRRIAKTVPKIIQSGFIKRKHHSMLETWKEEITWRCKKHFLRPAEKRLFIYIIWMSMKLNTSEHRTENISFLYIDFLPMPCFYLWAIEGILNGIPCLIRILFSTSILPRFKLGRKVKKERKKNVVRTD